MTIGVATARKERCAGLTDIKTFPTAKVTRLQLHTSANPVYMGACEDFKCNLTIKNRTMNSIFDKTISVYDTAFDNVGR